MVRSAVLALLALQPAPRPQFAWECQLPTQVVCGPDGCVEHPSTLRLVFEPAYNEYRRCFSAEASDCEMHDAVSTERKGYMLFQVPGRPLFATVASDLSAVEVGMMGSEVIISRGSCREVGPAIRIRPSTQD